MVLIIGPVLACSDSPQTRDAGRPAGVPSGPVVLEQIAAWQWALEDRGLPVGALVRGDSSAFVWTQRGEVYGVRPGSDAVEELRPAGGGGVITAWLGPPPAEAVIAVVGDGRLVSLGEGSGNRVVGACPVLVSARDAVSHLEEDRLFVVLSSAPEVTTERIVTLRTDGSTCYVASSVDSPCSMASASMAKDPVAGVIVACSDVRRPLFRLTTEAGRLSVDSVHASRIRSFAARVPGYGPLWHGMPIMQMDGGFLRVLADLRSDQRRFEFWDESGRHIRTSTVSVPIGFVASETKRHLLLGMRVGSGLELVLFGWAQDELS